VLSAGRALSLAVFAACASSGARAAAPAGEQTVRVLGATGSVAQISTTTTTGSKAVTLDASLDSIWRALPHAFESVGITLSHRDSGTGVVGNAGFKARRRLANTPLSRYLDCGSAQGVASADTYEIHLSVLTEVRAAGPQRTTLVTVVDATGQSINFKSAPIRCVSRGELENRIMDLVRAAVAR
jgi:hypothetical protein